MARLTDTILNVDSFNTTGRTAPMVDPIYGGAMGHAPDTKALVSSYPYVQRPIIPLVLEFPRGFEFLPNPDKWRAAYKALIEVHPRSIEGFNSQLSVEAREVAYGGDGQMMESPGNVTRNRVAPSFTYEDKYGRPIATYWISYILELIGDPNTKYPNVVNRAPGQILDLLPDFIGGTVLFFEPDPTLSKIDKAWLCSNFWPKTAPPYEGKRDITTGGDISSFSIEFASITQEGIAVNKLAQTLLTGMNLAGANPYLRPAMVDKLSADVLAAETGYLDQLRQAATVAVRP